MRNGIDCFLAHEAIGPTKQWQDVIEDGLRSCHALLAWLTPGFHESDWTDQEAGAMVGRGGFVIPANAGLLPYGFMARYQAMSVKLKDDDQLADEVFEILVNQDTTKEAMAEALVYKFEDSRSLTTCVPICVY